MKKTPPAAFVRSAAAPGDFPRGGLPEVAVFGRSNVGKSSLLNRLMGAKGMARVSKTPGRTRLINFFSVRDEFLLVDLPGYGFAKAPRVMRQTWEELVTSYLFGRQELSLALLLVDIRREPMANDLEVRDLLLEAGVSYAVVATKADKLKGSRLRQQCAVLRRVYGTGERVPLITFSAVTNEGRKELWKVIEKHVLAARQARKS